MNSVAKKEFDSEMVLEHSAVPNVQQLGKAHNSFELFLSDKDASGCIEWIIDFGNGNEEVQHIGVWFDAQKNLVDYDGVFSLNKQAVAFLRSAGFKVSKEFTE